MKLEVKVNFDFNKLANDMPKLMDEFLMTSKEETVKVSKEFIRSGSVTPALEKSTERSRRARGNPISPPLYEYHTLHDSIKATKEGIEMIRYGLAHHVGYGKLKERKFIQFQLAKDSMSRFIKAMRKSMHLSSPIVFKP